MSSLKFENIISSMIGMAVDRPNKSTSGTLSGHAAGEPFEKCVYQLLKKCYPNNIFKQYEYLNDLYLKHPKHITTEQRNGLIASRTAFFLLTRGERATREWNPHNIFEEKQNDTADILYYRKGFFDIIDVKTRNSSKQAQAPNIISAYKLAQMCALMIDNEEYNSIDIDYLEIDWVEHESNLICTDAHHGALFKACPDQLYINWSAGMQIQFHVKDLNQSWHEDRSKWARMYLRVFVESANRRREKMYDDYIKPFLKYIE